MADQSLEIRVAILEAMVAELTRHLVQTRKISADDWEEIGSRCRRRMGATSNEERPALRTALAVAEQPLKPTLSPAMRSSLRTRKPKSGGGVVPLRGITGGHGEPPDDEEGGAP